MGPVSQTTGATGAGCWCYGSAVQARGWKFVLFDTQTVRAPREVPTNSFGVDMLILVNISSLENCGAN